MPKHLGKGKLKIARASKIVTRIRDALTNRENEAVLAKIRKEVSAANQRFPLP